MALTAGEIVWKITGDKSGLDKSLRDSKKEAKGLGKAMNKIGGIIAGAFAVKSIFNFGKSLVKAGSDAQETSQKFGVVFRGITKEANAMAANLAKSYGMSTNESKKLLGNTGDLLTGFGVTKDEALKLSNEVQMLAADLASFSNVEGGAKFASEALTKGLFGETEQMKTLGIVVNQNSEEFKNLVKKYQQTEGKTLQQAKALAVLETATTQSKNAIGDFARSQDSWANIQKRLGAQTDDFAATIGQRLLPGLEKVGLALLNASGEGNILYTAFGRVADSISFLLEFVADLINGITDFVNYVDKEFGPTIDVIVKGFKLATEWGMPLVNILTMITGAKKKDSEVDQDAAQKSEKVAKKAITRHRTERKVIKEKTSALDEFNKKLGEVAAGYASGLGQIENMLSSINDLSSAMAESQISDLDRQMEKELEAAGLLEDSKEEQLISEIERAEIAGDAELANQKKKDLQRLKIEQKYAKKKAQIEYQAALVGWEMQLAMAIATLPIMIMNAYSSGAAIPYIGAVMGPIYAALAAAAGVVQIAAVGAAKPKPPSFQTGGIVPGSMAAGDAMAAQVNSGEMILNSSQQRNLFDIADGRQSGNSGNINVYLGDELIYSNLYDATKNGDLLIDTRAVVDA